MKNKLLLTLIVLFLGLQNSQASHFAGSDLTYTCLGGNSYLVSLSFYRDCSGINAPPAIQINASCTSNSILNFAVTLNVLSGIGKIITPSCSSSPTYCNNGTSYGIQEYTYQATIILAPCNSWILEYTSCCRNPITTVNSNNSNSWYIMATLNNLIAPSNSSPVFSNIPIVVAINNQNLTYSHGAIDPDGDSLVYSFFAPKTSSTANIIYTSPYDSSNFLSSSIPISLNLNTGEINLTPNQLLITATGVKVEEWRTINGTPTLIGAVYRDIQLNVYSNPNNSNPTLAGINTVSHVYSPLDTIYSMDVFATDPVNFSISGFDADTFTPTNTGHPELFSISWNQGIPQANFSSYLNGTNNAWAEFNWIPSLNDISTIPYCFTATIIDEACPYFGKQIFTYCLTVTAPPPLNIGNDTTICVNHNLTLDGGKGNFSYQWSTGDTTQTITIDGPSIGTGNHIYSLSRTGYGSSFFDDINVVVELCTGIDISNSNLIFSIQPNPNNGIFEIKIENNKFLNLELDIYSSHGKKVLSELISPSQNLIHKKIDLSNLASGIYLVRLQQEGVSHSQRIIIQ